ncbi:hypothetical protein DFH06DRAFT_1339954 [Mycena polygramma]|nr:hypothetical protein DFH06DRAFT_1339954 [Mycena polygramma]
MASSRASHPSSCFGSLQVQGTGATIIVATVDLILLLRIWILCERSRRALYFLLPLITVEFATMLCITTITINHLTEFVHVGFIHGCYALAVPKYFAVYPVPSFIVVLHICYHRIQASDSPEYQDTQSIALVFLRDGVLWFLVVVLINPPQIALWGWGRPTLTQVLMMPSLAAYSVVGGRVLLNMMEIAAAEVILSEDEPRPVLEDEL